MVIVDSIGELLPLLHLSSNSPDDFTTAHAKALKPFAQAGAAVIGIDHLAKNPDSRTQGASGTAAKRRAVGGTSLRVTIKDPFTPGAGGSAFVAVFKDRHGGLRAHCPIGSREPMAGVFTLTQEGTGLSWAVWPASESDTVSASGVSDKDIAELDGLDPPPASQRDVQDRLHWGGSRALNALRSWRQVRSGSAPQEQEQGQEQGGAADAPRSATPMSRSAEQSNVTPLPLPEPVGDWRTDGIETVTREVMARYSTDRRYTLEAATVVYNSARKFHSPAEMIPRTVARMSALCGHPLAGVTTDTHRCGQCILEGAQ